MEWWLAAAVPRWAVRFYLRHWKPIVGLSLVGSVQRLAMVGWGDAVPSGVAAASEVVVVVARVLLVVVVWRLAMRGITVAWPRIQEFVTAHWRSLVYQGLGLSVAFLVFDLGAEQGVSALLPEAWRQGYLAALLFVKNPTVIAFTVVWWIGMVRQACVTATPAASGRGPA
ncbi:hypothetical protein [Actinokineospora sp. UTMC 2448]|uniref:hypothetical protein n=1 Tax=Actinokineospora sp. UTMC 2448 TaxID=2268449 RepID=UPI0021648E76|nr:hypothetical protein [Actinokineospora sp. UTMC 2448]UVS80346.1 hypothetical protein Actkin_04096 [Actinokineospora sp. UTMC 2448]